MAKAELQAEVERLRDKCDRQAKMLARLFPDKVPYVYFICGEGGEKDEDGIPEYVHICPAFGCDFHYRFKRAELMAMEW